MLADIGLGFIISIFASEYFDFALNPGFIVGCVIFVLLPDWDFWFYKVFKSKFSAKIHDHRDVAHYPVAYLILSLVVYFLFGHIWATSFFILTMLHFVHDSLGIGWGVKWLWPFSEKTYKFFSQENNEFGLKFFARSSQELEQAIQKHHDPDWFKTYYCRLTVISVLEAVIFIVGLGLLVLSFN
jgi:hypothetical protein